MALNKNSGISKIIGAGIQEARKQKQGTDKEQEFQERIGSWWYEMPQRV